MTGSPVRKKIAHVTTAPVTLRYVLLNQLRAYQAAGYEVVAISSAGPEVTVIEEAGIRHIAVPMTRRVTPLADLVSLIRLWRIFRRERFDLVHTHNPKPGLIGQLAARLAGVPAVVNQLHGFYFHENMSPRMRAFYVAVEKIAARCSDVIFSHSAEDIETAVQEKIAAREKLIHLGGGIDLARFDPSRVSPDRLTELRRELGLPDDALIVGFVGRLVREKGVIELLEAARQIRREIPNVRFLAIGPLDPEKPDALCPRIAADYGVEDVFIFTGEHQDMPDLYALMDVFTLPSYREGMPLVVMEAQAMGVPCVVTDIRGSREIVLDGDTGNVVPVRDASVLARSVTALLLNEERRLQMARAATTNAADRFNEEALIERVLSAYAAVLNS